MIKAILVPLDGSQTAEHALPWARTLSRRTGATVELARVRSIPPVFPTGEGLSSFDQGVAEWTEKEEDDYMAKVVADWSDPDSQTNLTSNLLEPKDSIASTLVAFADSRRADLTIMTRQGHGVVSRLMFGSVTDEYLRSSHNPTLLVRASSPELANPLQQPKISNVIVPLDGSRFSEQAVSPALILFEWFGCEITLLLVISPNESIQELSKRVGGELNSENTWPTVTELAEDYLKQLAKRLRRETSKISIKVVEHLSPAEAILQEISSPEVAVAIATHGQGGLTRMLLGSVADKVVRGSNGPVLVVRPKADE